MEQKTVLVADKSSDLRQLLYQSLNWAYNVVLVEDGEKAISALTAMMVDLTILDLDLPLCDGFEALRIIRDEENGWPKMPVMILTARTEPEYALKAWSIGADIYMTKPFSSASLLESVAYLLATELV